MEWHDFVGSAGAAMIVIAYAMLQIERIDSRALAYSAMNAIGAGLILLSLTIEFNFSAFVIEAFWLVISVAGIVRATRKPVGRVSDDA